MDAVISRIIEIERASARDLEQAEEASRQKIEAHRLSLEQEKERIQNVVISEENERLSKTILEAKAKSDADSGEFQKDSERPFSDPVTVQTIKESILSILFEG